MFLHLLRSVLYVHSTRPADAADFACAVNSVSKALSDCSSWPNEQLVKYEKMMTSLQQAHGFLACRIEPIIMSAGELEHEWAGTPGRLIRERYRKAAEVSRVSPRICGGAQFCGVVPDLQAMLHMSSLCCCYVNEAVASIHSLIE